MVHRSTPLASVFRAFSSGGARSVVDQVDDSKLLQEMSGSFMHNESRKAIEAPQNYGFTSVVFDAEKNAMGKILASAETFIGFMGGSRAFPVTGNMDDRRHRMYKLEKGDTAMFRGRGDKQQFHMTEAGGYWTAPQDKTVRMQLIAENSQSNKAVQQDGGGGGGQSSAASVDTRDASGGGNGASGGGQQQQQKRGQEALYKKGKDSKIYVDMTKDATRASGKEVHILLDDGKIYAHIVGKEVYLGGKKGEGTFGRVGTDKGLSVNVYAKVG